MISVILPSAALHERLAPHLGDVRAEVWAPGYTTRFPGPADLLVLPYMMPPEYLRWLEGLQVGVIQSQTLGYDGVAAHLPVGITFCNAVDVHESSTAELAIGLVVSMLRGIPDAVRNAGRGVWNHRRQPGLAGKRVLLVGVGGVGSQITRRLAPFDVELTLVGRTPRGTVHGIEELPALLPQSDVVIMAVPLTAETRGLVNARFLSLMPDDALVVNVSRGEIVDTTALVAELRQGRLRAALDVTDPEPLPSDHALWRLPGVLITPHLGGDTDAMDTRVDRVILEQVRRLSAGEAPLNVVLGPGR